MTPLTAQTSRDLRGLVRVPSVLLAGVLILTTVIGCRPSQQARRSTDASSRRTAGSVSSAGVRSDSLVLIQQRLLMLIDTMADVMEHDRARIRQLELEISRLKSILGRYGIQGLSEPIPSPAGAPSKLDLPVPAATPPVPGQQMPTSSSVTGPGTPKVTVTATALAQPGPDAARIYTEALQAFNSGKYQRALDLLTDLRRTDPNSSYAPNYEYWRGESFYALGQYERAIQSFNIVLVQFPGSTKSDDAEFKIAESYARLGNEARARVSYERLLALHPDTEYRSRAEAKLRQLR